MKQLLTEPKGFRTVDAASAEHLHIPTPGDHYSVTTGSAVMTIVYQMARYHEGMGKRTRVIVSRGTRHDYPVGECVEVAGTSPVPRWQKLLDCVSGRLGGRRYFGEARYRPAARAIEPGFSGAILVHNEPAPLQHLRRTYPHAKLCLWLHNELFKTYTQKEVARVEKTVDRLICVSRHIASGVEQKLGTTSAKIVIVHNGADLEVFAPVEKPFDEPPVILFVGRIQPIKGPDLLVKAAVALHRAGRSFRMRIVGSAGFSADGALSPYEQELRNLAKEAGGRVEFVPFTDRKGIVEEFQRASILAVPSNWDDPCPLTVSEGLAAGLAMVVAQRGGIPEVGGDAVLYFTPPDIEGLTARLNDLLENPERRAELGRRAHQRSSAFSWQASYQRLTEGL